jgi:hypothetical protein
VVLIGHKGHPEVEGTLGQYDDTGVGMYLIEDASQVDSLPVFSSPSSKPTSGFHRKRCSIFDISARSLSSVRILLPYRLRNISSFPKRLASFSS